MTTHFFLFYFRIEVVDIIGIGDYDGKTRNRRRVVTREGQIMYRGRKYAEEKETGYMVCTTGKRERLHDRMWLEEGSHPSFDGNRVPDGYVVHHIDMNKKNNVIGNLTLVSVKGHNLVHNRKKGETRRVIIVPGGVSYIVDEDEREEK